MSEENVIAFWFTDDVVCCVGEEKHLTVVFDRRNLRELQNEVKQREDQSYVL